MKGRGGRLWRRGGLQDLLDFDGTEKTAGNQFTGMNMGGTQQRVRALAENRYVLCIGPGATAAHARQKAPCIVAAQRDRGVIGQQRIGRQQRGQAFGVGHGFKRFERDALALRKRSGGHTAQARQVAATAQGSAAASAQPPKP